MPLNFKLIGRQVKESRKLKHVSQAELAERIDMSVSYISHIENAKKQASLEVLVRISNELGTTIDKLLLGNQIYVATEDQAETNISLLLSDCSIYEKQILFELVCASKKSLRDNAWLIENVHIK